MKKRLLSILLMCCMVLTLLPTAAFAEGSEEELPVCTCETACTAESLNADCPVCGAEDALPENCAKREVSAPQPETALTALIGGSETVTAVSTADELTAAIADSNVSTVRLAGDISISSSLTVTRTVTLDLNGHVLQMTGNNSDPVIEVKKDSNGVGIGNLTLTDSAPNTAHKFTPNADGLWVLNEENGTETVNGGVITGSKEMGIWVNGGYGSPLTQKPAEADCAHLIMTGGNIVGCAAATGGGVFAGFYAYFTMTGGSIRGCVANYGGGVFLSYNASFAMGGSALIADCISTVGGSCGGGGIGADLGALVALSGNAVIKNCTAQHGGGVYLNDATLTMSENASVTGCNSIAGGGVSARGNATESDPPVFTMEGSSSITDCTALNGGGIFVSTNGGKVSLSGSAKIKNCRTVERDGVDFPDVTGGGVHVLSGSFEMSGGSIESCTAVNGGDSVFVCTEGNGKFTMTGGTVDGSITMPYTVGNNTVYMDGLGTAAYPYQISTADQLKLFRDIVNGAGGQTQNRGAWAVLTNDIVLNDGTFAEDGSYTPGPSGKTAEEWTPIGKYTDDGNNTPYTGTFDGKHYAIKGLYVVNLPDVAVGLFGGLKGAAVRNLTVDGYVQGCDFVSGIAGDAKANSTIENCRNDCHVVSEYGVDSGSFLYAGGIVGSAADTTIAGCVNTGVVEARGSNNFGSVAAGIVGILYGNATVINCYNTGEINVTGDKLREGTAGGIAGKDIDAHNTVSDCYNVGAVTVEYTGNSDSYIAMVGGIMGKIFYFDTTVSNCYSVGTLTSTTGTGTSYIGGVVGITKGTVANCYYLDSTAEKAVWPDGGTVDEATGSKTAAQLGNGTVLALLINGRADSEHPWNSQCQYLAAAGKTLPVFKTQTGDKHTHDWSVWTSNDDGTHSRRCCTCNAVETQNCSGGKATCKDKAVCEFCKASYGSLDPNNHTDLKHIDAKAATAAAEGNIEYWYCEDCNKYFSDADAKNVITQAQTVIPKRQSSGGGSGGSSSYPITVPSKTENGTVTVSPKNASAGSTVTITVKPDSGYVLETISVTDKNGNDLKLTDKSNGKYTFTMPTSKVEIKVTFMEDNSVLNFFYDVPNDAYYYEAVKWAAENGITGGVGNSLFAPNQPCTRAQIVTFLWRAAGSPAPKSMSSFTDVPADAFYAKAVAWAVENGITSGTGEGKFSPNAICTRAQSVTFLYRTSGSPAVSGSAEFSDVSTTAFYADAVAWAAKKGITTGIGGGLFGSDNDCTRSQIVTFLWRCKK